MQMTPPSLTGLQTIWEPIKGIHWGNQRSCRVIHIEQCTAQCEQNQGAQC